MAGRTRYRGTNLPLGKVKFWGHRWARGLPVPIFVSRAMNRAIDAHADRIQRARTRRRRRDRPWHDE